MGGGSGAGGGGGGTGGGSAFDAGPDPFCSVTCVDPFECQPNRMGGACVPAYILFFTQPSLGQTFSGPATTTADFAVSLRRTDGGFPTIPSVPFAIPGLAPAPPNALNNAMMGVYRVTAALPLDTRTFTAFAGWDGGPQSTVSFNVDRLPPMVTLQLPPAAGAGAAYLRDDVVPVAIHSSKPLSATITLTMAGTDGGISLQSAPVANTFCAGLSLGTNDRCGLLDFATPPMGGPLSGTFTVSVTALDSGGNSGSNSMTVPVTRLRWRNSVATTTASVRAAPALDSQGNLFVGTQDSLTTGRVISFTPNGAQRFTVATGAVMGISISDTDTGSGQREYAYVSTATGLPSASLYTMLTDGGVGSFVGSTCLDGNRQTSSAIGLFDAGTLNGGTEVSAVMVFNARLASDIGTVCTWGPRSGATTANGNLGMAQPDGVLGLSPANLVVFGKRAFFQRTDNTLGTIDLGPLSYVGGSAGYGGLSTVGTGLAIGGNTIVSTWTNASTSAPIATYPLSNPSTPTTFPFIALWNTARPAAIYAGNAIVQTDRSNLNWLVSMSLSGTVAPVAAPLSGVNTGGTTSVVGTGPRVYSVRRDGNLYVYDASSTTAIAGASPVVSDALFTSSVDVVAHPTLDCSRSGIGRPGTLYVVALDGRITAVIVDSTRLEPTAAWPKWQRTAGNSGNPDFPLNPGCP